MSIRTRIDRLESGHNSDKAASFEFGVHYMIFTDADLDTDQNGNERREYSIHPPALKPGEYFARETPYMMTSKQLEELLAAIDGNTRTITPDQSKGRQP